jgi:hypothetical protein
MSRRLNFAEKPEVRGFRPPMVYVYEDATWEYKRLSRDLVHEQLPTGEEMNTLGREAGSWPVWPVSWIWCIST